MMAAPVRLDFVVTAGGTTAAFLEEILKGNLVGRRCPSCEKVYLPLGGGGQYKTHIGSAGLNLALQLFHNVVRPSKGTVWDLRLLVEVAF